MKQTLLVEANTVLATAVRRAIITRAANLGIVLAKDLECKSRLLTFLFLQYLHAMAVRCRGAGAG